MRFSTLCLSASLLAMSVSLGACASMDPSMDHGMNGGMDHPMAAGSGGAHMADMAQASSMPAMAAPMTQAGVTSMIASWPQASRMAAADMMQKYGPPQEATASMLLWRNNGPWAWTRIDNMETEHLFPARHTDVMEQAISYRVPPAMFDELAAYDGSVYVRRTQGWISARCDKEGANFLALNLAHDIIENRRTVADARRYYAHAIQTFMANGQMDPYMQRLTFTPPRTDQADHDMMAPPSS